MEEEAQALCNASGFGAALCWLSGCCRRTKASPILVTQILMLQRCQLQQLRGVIGKPSKRQNQELGRCALPTLAGMFFLFPGKGKPVKKDKEALRQEVRLKERFQRHIFHDFCLVLPDHPETQERHCQRLRLS